jgi:CheY-like chemotaxis protein
VLTAALTPRSNLRKPQPGVRMRAKLSTPMRTRILLVDDDADGRDALGALLRLWGYRVDVAETGARAIELTVSRRPDIVILDLGLPDMMGEAVCVAVKVGPAPPFVVAYSGYHRLEAEARAAGCDAFVLKPELEQLKRLLGDRPAQKKASGQ